jgi:hypothetical protein
MIEVAWLRFHGVHDLMGGTYVTSVDTPSEPCCQLILGELNVRPGTEGSGMPPDHMAFSTGTRPCGC